MQVLKGFIFEDDAPINVTITAKSQGDPPYDRVGANIDVQIAEESGRIRYRSVVELGDRMPDAPEYDNLPPFSEPFSKSVKEGYEEWLFHGPIFQAITRVEGVVDDGIVVEIRPCAPANAVNGVNGNTDWQLDPVVIDSGLQGGLLWARQALDATPIPLGFKQIRRYGSFEANNGTVMCHVYADLNEKGRTAAVHMAFIGEDERLIAHVEGVNCPYNSSLNRLGGHETYAPLGA